MLLLARFETEATVLRLADGQEIRIGVKEITVLGYRPKVVLTFECPDDVGVWREELIATLPAQELVRGPRSQPTRRQAQGRNRSRGRLATMPAAARSA